MKLMKMIGMGKVMSLDLFQTCETHVYVTMDLNTRPSTAVFESMDGVHCNGRVP
jgi:hypothetical protein